MKEHRISNEENHCYECGGLISTDKHFCDKECADRFFQRYGEKEGIKELKKQTKYRKRNNLPRHQINPIDAFFRFGRISGPPKTQDFLRQIKKMRDLSMRGEEILRAAFRRKV